MKAPSLLLAIFLSLKTLSMQAQNDSLLMKIVNANDMIGGDSVKILTGNVILKQGSYTFFCDNAFVDLTTNKITASGHTKISKPNQVIYSGTHFQYFSEKRMILVDGKEIYLK